MGRGQQDETSFKEDPTQKESLPYGLLGGGGQVFGTTTTWRRC